MTGPELGWFVGGSPTWSESVGPPQGPELERCAQSAIELVTIPVASYSMVAVVSENNPLQCATLEQLGTALGVDQGVSEPESEPSSGSEPELPSESDPAVELTTTARPVEVYGPDPGSLARQALMAMLRMAEDEVRNDIAPVGDPGQLATTIGPSDTAIGLVTLAALDRVELDGLRALEIAPAPDSACVAPTVESTLDGRYPMSGRLMIGVGLSAGGNTLVNSFVDALLAPEFYEKAVRETLGDNLYQPLNDDQLSDVRRLWASR